MKRRKKIKLLIGQRAVLDFLFEFVEPRKKSSRKPDAESGARKTSEESRREKNRIARSLIIYKKNFFCVLNKNFRYKRPSPFSLLASKFKFCNHDKLGVCTILLSSKHLSPVYTAQTNTGRTRVKTNPGCVYTTFFQTNPGRTQVSSVYTTETNPG